MSISSRISYSLVLLLGVLLCACSPNEDRAGSVDKVSREHRGDKPVRSAASEPAPKVAVAAEFIAYGETNDGLLRGYFAYPEQMTKPLPAIIMIHEWWGLNDNMQAMAERMAGEGYMVLAIDLYAGKIAQKSDQARALMISLLENPELADANIESAYGFLDDVAGAPKIASVGWCLGGYWSLKSSTLLPQALDAAVIYYGQLITDEEQLSTIDAPILGLFAGEDSSISQESVTIFGDTMRALGKEVEIHTYPGVGHAFANPSGTRYNADAAQDAWQRTLSFLAEQLR